MVGAGLITPNSLSVYFRKTSALLPEITIYNGVTETDTGLLTGVDDDHWHTFAVNFDQDQDHLRIYVDGLLAGDLDLTTFAGGIYQNYSNTAVGIGFFGGSWADNFFVGAP